MVKKVGGEKRYCISSEVVRTVCSWNLITAIIATVLIQFQGISEFIRDTLQFGTGTVYDLARISMDTGTFQLLMPTVAAMVYVPVFFDDIRTGIYRPILMRCGSSKRYLLSKITVCGISSFSAVYLGMWMFVLILSARCPLLDESHMSFINGGCEELLTSGNIYAFFALQNSFRAIAGVAWAMIGLSFVAVFNDLSLALIAPSLIRYLFTQLLPQSGFDLRLYALEMNALWVPGVIKTMSITFSAYLIIASIGAVFFWKYAMRRMIDGHD